MPSEAVAIRRERIPSLAQLPKFDLLMAAVAILLSLVLLILFHLESITVTNLNLGLLLLQCGVPILSAAAYCHWAGYVKLRDGCTTVAWACLFVNLLQLPQYAAARSALPFHDSLITQLDRCIGIDCAALVNWTRAHPAFNTFSRVSYGLLEPIVCAALLITCLSGKVRSARRLILATILCAMIAAAISAVFPVLGAWSGFGFEPSTFQAAYNREIGMLRSSGTFVANREFNTGLITFPSFHVCLAVLCAHTLWPFRLIRIPAAVAALLIAMATVTTGWHYATDGIFGVMTACIGILAINRIFPWLHD